MENIVTTIPAWEDMTEELKNVVPGLSGQILPLLGESHHSILKQGNDTMCGLVKLTNLV